MAICEICGEKISAHATETVFGRTLCSRCAYQLRNLASEYEHQRESAKEYFVSCITEADAEQKKAVIQEILVHAGHAEVLSLPQESIKQTAASSSESDMFSNIGGKIKGLAKLITWLGIIASCITGISLIFANKYLALTGILVMVGGSLLSWIMSFCLYAFGEIAENTKQITIQLSKLSK